MFKTVTLTLALWSSPAAGQYLSTAYTTHYRPPGVEYRVLRSPHFDVIYQIGTEAEAREAAAVLEEQLPGAAEIAGAARTFRMPVVVSGFNDRSNGFVAPFPFRQEIDAAAIRGNTLSARHSSWMRQVVPHELVHAAQAASGRGFGVGAVVRRFSPDMLRSLNLWIPQGMSEGAAVYHESRVEEGAGRLNHSLFQMRFRASMASEGPWRLAQFLEVPTYTRSASRTYQGGANFFRYVTDSLGADVFPRAMAFHYRFPFLGFGPEIWYGARMSPARLGRRFREEMHRWELARQEAMKPFSERRRLTTARGRDRRNPQWLDDSTLVAYVTGYDVRPGLYRFDAESGEASLLSGQLLPKDNWFQLDAADRTILFSRYVHDPFAHTAWTADAFRVDLRTGEYERLTFGERVHAPVDTPVGPWALRNAGQFNEWVTLGGETVTETSRTTFIELAPSPSGTTVAVLARVEGYQGIFRTSPDGGRLAPWLFVRDAAIHDVSWSADGKFLLFSADPGTVSNVYACEVESGRVVQLTNVPYGALEGALSPDGSTLAFVESDGGGHYLALMPFEPLNAQPVGPEALFSPDAIPDPHEERRTAAAHSAADIGPYHAIGYLRPRTLYPTARHERIRARPDDTDLGIGFGLGVQGGDPLRRWAYAAEGFRQSGRVWGRMNVETAALLVRPSLSVYDEPSTLVASVRTADGVETRRVGREKRGVDLTLRVPAVLASNSHRSELAVSVGAQYEEERFFDRQGRTLLRFAGDRAFSGRYSVTPAALLSWRMQSNRRDLWPNTGTVLWAGATLDVWHKAKEAEKGFVAILSRYVSLSLTRHTAVRLRARFLTQNRGSIYDLDTFLPRGHENVYPGAGSYAGAGVEILQPLRYVENGFVLVPLYVKALYAYGFAETLRRLGGGGRFSSAGAGLGMRFRLYYLFDFDLRIGATYVVEERRFALTYR